MKEKERKKSKKERKKERKKINKKKKEEEEGKLDTFWFRIDIHGYIALRLTAYIAELRA